MRKHIYTIFFVLLFLVGFSILLYPSVSSFVNGRSQSRVIAQYDAALSRLDSETNRRMIFAAHEYNRNLITKPNRYSFTAAERAAYHEMLDVSGIGVMGYIEIEAIGVRLPIYHGTDESVLQIGAGHLEWSSLPIGGPGTHSAITAHTGLPSSELFNKLNRLTYGDTFVVRVLKEEIIYAVDQILIVEPNDIRALAIETGADYCTLITCTPYGINSHRLLVRGVRVQSANTDFLTDRFTIDGLVSFLMLLALLSIAYQYLRKK